MFLRSFAACLAVLAMCAPAPAQAQEVERNLLIEIDALAREIIAQRAKTPGASPSVLDDENLARTLTILGLLRRMPAPLSAAEIEDSRVDEQLGAGPGAAGTTNLVSKGGIPAILALAVENGALMQSISGTTVTFQGNPAGIIGALAKKGFDELVPDARAPWTQRVSFSASFDTSRGNPSGETQFTADRQQLSQWTTRIEIVNRRELSDPRYRVMWEVDLGRYAANVAGAALTAKSAVNDRPLNEWASATDTALRLAGEDVNAVRVVLQQRIEGFPRDGLSANTQKALDELAGAYSDLVATRASMLNRVAEGLLVTLEYANNRPSIGSQLSTLRFIAAQGGSVELTANASMTFFHDGQPGVDRLKEFAVAGQIDVPLSRGSALGTFVLSAAARATRARHDPATPPELLATAGGATIAIGQLKLTIPVPGAGVRIPLSISFANRTELIKESIVRANVGITYDLDAIFARVRP
jgi:hypothetical protein